MPATSFDMNAVGACDAIRQEATALAGMNAPFLLGRATGALDFITDPQNVQGLSSEVVSSSDEKVTTLRILYDQRTKPCQVSTDPNTNVCVDTPTSPPRKQAFVNIDKKITTPARYFSNADMVVLCKEMGDDKKAGHIRDRLQNDLRAGRERLDEIILAELSARRGKIYSWDGTTTAAGSSKTLQLLSSTGGQDVPLPSNYVNMTMDYQNMQFEGVPAVIGQGYFDKYMKLQQMACCNSTTPFSQAVEAAGMAYYFDQAANAVLGANQVVVMPYGIIRLLTFNKNNNINFSTPQEAHTVVTDPVNPFLKWNLDFKWDCDTERWKYQYSIHWTLFNVIQSDSFGIDSGTPDCGDELFGITGVAGYNITRA